jgi:hypothetical protein
MTVQPNIQVQKIYSSTANKYIPSFVSVDKSFSAYARSGYFTDCAYPVGGSAIEDHARYDFGHPTSPSVGLETVLRAAGVLFLFTFVNADTALANRVIISLPRPQSVNSTIRQDATNVAVVSQTLVNSTEPIANLVGKMQKLSGLTLEFVAPLLGVSRRAIQNWKKGETISLKNEIKLRALVETIEKLNQGNATKTKNVLLERTPGYLRIYDLIAQGRFPDAIARAEQKEPLKPIRSNPNQKFDHLPLAIQLSRTEDGPFVPAGPRMRSLSRRLKTQS